MSGDQLDLDASHPEDCERCYWRGRAEAAEAAALEIEGLLTPVPNRLNLDAAPCPHGTNDRASCVDCLTVIAHNMPDTLVNSHLALVAEVRRLRARVEELEDDNTAGTYEDLRIKFPGVDDDPPTVIA